MAQPAPARLNTALAAACLTAAILFAYAGSFHAPFVFDDLGAVVNNPTIRELWSWQVLQPPRDGSTTTGRPLVNLSFALNFAMTGERVWSYHALNVAIHVAAALTLLGLVRRLLLLQPPAAGDSERTRRAFSLALLAAFTWALHPLQTESVISVAQRTELLFGLFYLLCLYAFHRGAAGEGSRRWLAVSVASCALGMTAKEAMVTAPVMVLLYDRTFIAGSFAQAWSARRGFYLALAASWLVLGALLLGMGGARGVSAGLGLGVSPWHYLLTQCEALVLYLKLAVWPHPLVLDYGTSLVSSAGEVVGEGVLILALLAGTVWALRWRPRLGFVGASFFVLLAPSSSVVPLVTQTMAEHRMYLPLAALVVGAVAALHACGGVLARRGLAAGVAALALATADRGRDFRDPVTLWRQTVAARPQNPRAHNNLALALHAQGNADAGNRHFARAVALDPGYLSARHNWAVALLAQNRANDAIAQFQAAIRIAESDPAASRSAEARADVADAHVQLARLCERSGDPAGAERHFAAALRLTPNHAEAHAGLGLLHAKAERFEPAAAHLQEAVRLAPEDTDALANLGNVLLLQGRAREAIECYEQVLRLRPGDRGVLENIQLARASLR